MARLSVEAMVREFHQAFGLKLRDRPPTRIPKSERDLRYDLQDEETGELAEALDANDIVAIADALGDIVYVAYGSAVQLGIDLDLVLAEIHRSNMSKLGPDGQPIYREDGKVLKGPGYFKPDIAGVLDV